MNSTELKHGLAQFTGTEHYYQHPLSQMKYTDGVHFFAENAGGGAYWFLDIASTELFLYRKYFAFLKISIRVRDGSAQLVAEDGNEKEIWTRHLKFTDCPDGCWEFYLTDGILLLASEY